MDFNCNGSFIDLKLYKSLDELPTLLLVKLAYYKKKHFKISFCEFKWFFIRKSA